MQRWQIQYVMFTHLLTLNDVLSNLIYQLLHIFYFYKSDNMVILFDCQVY